MTNPPPSLERFQKLHDQIRKVAHKSGGDVFAAKVLADTAAVARAEEVRHLLQRGARTTESTLQVVASTHAALEKSAMAVRRVTLQLPAPPTSEPE